MPPCFELTQEVSRAKTWLGLVRAGSFFLHVMMLQLMLSIIILAYNEESYLQACLQAIARQTVKPFEVIMVDNNSTDNTVKIAKKFPFVKVVSESVQGMIPARNKGFSVANGDVLVRIDADSQLRPDWVETAEKIFSDKTVNAVSGLALTKTLPQDWAPYTRLWSRMYMLWTEAEFGIPILWGANMALRKNAWDEIKDKVCMDDKLVHEDQDLSYLLAGQNKKVIRSNNLLIKTAGESYFSWDKFYEYFMRRRHTKNYHRMRGTLANANFSRFTWAQRTRRFVAVLFPGIVFIFCSTIVYLLKLAISYFFRLKQVTQE